MIAQALRQEPLNQDKERSHPTCKSIIPANDNIRTYDIYDAVIREEDDLKRCIHVHPKQQIKRMRKLREEPRHRIGKLQILLKQAKDGLRRATQDRKATVPTTRSRITSRFTYNRWAILTNILNEDQNLRVTDITGCSK